METLPRVLALLLLFFIGMRLANSQGLSLDGQVRPNVSMIEVTSTSQQIDCTSPGDLAVGTWHFPSGAAIPEGSTPPVYAVYRSFTKIAHLNVQKTLPEEGIYSCRIPAQSGTIISLYVGLYNSISAGTPQLEDTISLKVIDSPGFLFSLNCPSSSFPPTTVTWSHNGASLPDNVGRSFQVLKDAPSTKFDNVLHVTESLGRTFTCEVRNSAGANSRSIFVKAPDAVVDLRATPDITSLLISWNPPNNGSRKYLTGYLISYRIFKEWTSSLSRIMVNKNITSYEVRKLQPNLTYEVRVQAAVEAMLGQVVTVVVSTLSYTSASTRFTSTKPTEWIYFFTGVVVILLGAIILILMLIIIHGKVTARKQRLEIDITRNDSYTPANCINRTALSETKNNMQEYEEVMTTEYFDSSRDFPTSDFTTSGSEEHIYAEVDAPDLESLTNSNPA